MDQLEGIPFIKSPLFNGNNFAFWSIRLRNYLMALRLEIWKFVVNRYEAPITSATYTTRIRLYINNSRVVNAIMG